MVGPAGREVHVCSGWGWVVDIAVEPPLGEREVHEGFHGLGLVRVIRVPPASYKLSRLEKRIERDSPVHPLVPKSDVAEGERKEGGEDQDQLGREHLEGITEICTEMRRPFFSATWQRMWTINVEV